MTAKSPDMTANKIGNVYTWIAYIKVMNRPVSKVPIQQLRSLSTFIYQRVPCYLKGRFIWCSDSFRNGVEGIGCLTHWICGIEITYLGIERIYVGEKYSKNQSGPNEYQGVLILQTFCANTSYPRCLLCRSWKWAKSTQATGVYMYLTSCQYLFSYGPGVGVTKAPFVNFSVSKVFDPVKVPVRLLASHSYLTGVTAAELRQHMSNMNVIYNS